ncbi:SigE family RNA polymerase sigma factor [Catenulispora pinisilvae]|uniref:SigE family RNA polymerase sigma factor n=1 Tax=Catenulispora pinisilvae TaxID=2705253 RepID=UPI0018918E15|nr:SigE family RNA polymerase sigma factor [Catenulispora pinisilvae]
MRASAEAEYKEYVTARSHALWHTAHLLCGDAHQAEDVVQTALLKLYVAWHRVERAENRDAYVRRVLVRCVIDEKRRGWRRERSVDVVPESAAPEGSDIGERDAVLQALARLAPRQRATLVLRFWEDLSIEQTADLLDCSPGTVRSQTARGLATLRGILLDQQATASGRAEKES